MVSEGTYNWPGKSGGEYAYRIYKLPASFNDTPGNYIFAVETSPRTWTPIYIGETEDLSERFDQHHAMPCISEYLATHIHVHANDGGRADRDNEADDLIARWDPPCNA